MPVIRVLLVIVSFVLIWIGAGLIVRSLDRFAHRLKFSSFALSFFVLGMLTSTPEITLGINAVIEGDPEIFVGNLIGGVIVIFLLIIPLFAIAGNGIHIDHQMNSRNLLLCLVVCAVPAFVMSDRIGTLFEGVLLILLYLLLFYFIEKRKGFIEEMEEKLSQNVHKTDAFYLLKIIGGIGMVFIGSRIVVDQTHFFSELYHVSPFFISFVMLSVGTNLPELSLGVRSVLSGKKVIAFGDYLGSAAANTIIMGVLILINRHDVVIPNHFYQRFFFIVAGLSLFYVFARSKQTISRKEGIVLLAVYIVFLLVELV